MIIFIHWLLCFQILMIDIRNVISFYPFMSFIFHSGLFVGSSLGHSTGCPSQPVRWSRRWLGRKKWWWDSTLPFQAWKLGRIHPSHGRRWVAWEVLQNSRWTSQVWIGLVGETCDSRNFGVVRFQFHLVIGG